MREPEAWDKREVGTPTSFFSILALKKNKGFRQGVAKDFSALYKHANEKLFFTCLYPYGNAHGGHGTASVRRGRLARVS